MLNGSAPYCAAKAGIGHLVECLGYELTPKGYDVFGIHPSNVANTPMTEATVQGLIDYRGLSREQAWEYWGSGKLTRQWLAKQDISSLIVNMMKSESSIYQSGSNIELKAGQR